MKKCFFIGHRDAGERILPHIKNAAEKFIRQSEVTEFHVGGYGSFDRLAGQAVIALKAAYPHIQLYRATSSAIQLTSVWCSLAQMAVSISPGYRVKKRQRLTFP